MPKRPRSHQLEDESRTAFRTVLPAEWVFHDLGHDYGIDGEAEIFDEKGEGTGLRFYIQLKATDEPILDRALAISLRLDTCNYYRLHDLPILIVLYHAPTKKLYVKWFHTFDSYYSPRKASKNVPFKLTREDEWQDETPARLTSHLKVRRQVGSPQLALPVMFTLTITEPQIHGVPAAQIASEIRKAVASLPGIIRIGGTTEPQAHFRIVISNGKVVADLAGIKSFTLHTDRGYDSALALSKFPYDVLVSVALVLSHAGHSNIAAQLVAKYSGDSSIIQIPEIAWRLAGCMAIAHRVAEGLRLAQTLFENTSSLDAAKMFLLSGLIQSDSIPNSELGHLRKLMCWWIDRAEKSGDLAEAATAHYNLGNHYRGSQNARLALGHYRQAAKYDPGYLERRYFCREVAGIFFEAGRYHLSAHFYERSITLGESGDCHALYADALMFAGKYSKSQEIFDSYIASNPDARPEWRLKAWALRAVRSTLELDEQKRSTVAALRLAGIDHKNWPYTTHARGA